MNIQYHGAKFVKVFFSFFFLLQIFVLRMFPFNKKIIGLYCDAINSAQSRLISEFTFFNKNYKFRSSSSFSEYRVRTALTKEPDTIDWIQSFSEDDVLYDIGANIGLYSIIAAKSKGAAVYAFEPSFHNLNHLVENIQINDVRHKVCVVPCPLFQSTTFDKFTLSEPFAGSAIANFATGLDQSGDGISNEYGYNTLGISLDDLVETSGIQLPTKIKLDVDGIEHLILSGAKRLLNSETLSSVLVEVSDDFLEQNNMIQKLLLDANFSLDASTERNRMSTSKNQIWVK